MNKLIFSLSAFILYISVFLLACGKMPQSKDMSASTANSVEASSHFDDANSSTSENF